MPRPFIQTITQTIYPKYPVEFESSYSIEQSVARLKERVVDDFAWNKKATGFCGGVTEDEVVIRKSIFFRRPYLEFYGEFENNDQKVSLRGIYSTHEAYRTIITIWFLFLFVWIGIATILVISTLLHEPHQIISQPIIALFPVFGGLIGIVAYQWLRFCWWLSRSDIEAISQTVREALSKPTAS